MAPGRVLLCKDQSQKQDGKSQKSKQKKGTADCSKQKNNKETHLDKNKFSCKTNAKIIFQSSDTSQHMGTHEKLFTCATCRNSFCYKDKLNFHIASHTGEKPFICATCGEGFITKTDLSVHERTHNKPFFCLICGESFTEKGTLIYHMKVHTGEKPFTS
uniref:C2H2-type domain-containing protein n=1 Tax=Cyprinodon variegatus TaxID=28743 RepID=A0A3Q2CW73_CYPVA